MEPCHNERRGAVVGTLASCPGVQHLSVTLSSKLIRLTEDGVVTYRTKVFTVGKYIILCISEHNDVALHSTTFVTYHVCIMLIQLNLVQLALPFWRRVGEAIPPGREIERSALTSAAGFRSIDFIVEKAAVLATISNYRALKYVTRSRHLYLTKN